MLGESQCDGAADAFGTDDEGGFGGERGHVELSKVLVSQSRW